MVKPEEKIAAELLPASTCSPKTHPDSHPILPSPSCTTGGLPSVAEVAGSSGKPPALPPFVAAVQIWPPAVHSGIWPFTTQNCHKCPVGNSVFLGFPIPLEESHTNFLLSMPCSTAVQLLLLCSCTQTPGKRVSKAQNFLRIVSLSKMWVDQIHPC